MSPAEIGAEECNGSVRLTDGDTEAQNWNRLLVAYLRDSAHFDTVELFRREKSLGKDLGATARSVSTRTERGTERLRRYPGRLVLTLGQLKRSHLAHA